MFGRFGARRPIDTKIDFVDTFVLVARFAQRLQIFKIDVSAVKPRVDFINLKWFSRSTTKASIPVPYFHLLFLIFGGLPVRGVFRFDDKSGNVCGRVVSMVKRVCQPICARIVLGFEKTVVEI